MNADKNTALYEKMAAEQDKFRDWLKTQPPEEILNHAYEYVVREDILMAMEELDLPQSRAAALLASPSPLADVYKEFADRETSYMDVVRDSIEQRAEAALDTQRELPLYRHDAAHAREQGDLDLYRASRRANIACKEAIETAIADNYRDNRLDRDAVPQVIEQFGYLRKMALDGYVVHLELPELKELVSLMRRSSNNLNQLTRRVHETGRIYDADLEDISQRQEALWDGVHQVLTQLAKLS